MPEADPTWTAPDGVRFGYRLWAPPGEPLAIVLAVHGLGCRAGDFEPLAEGLKASGIALAAWNLRGQGLDPVAKRRGAWLELDGQLADLEAFAAEVVRSDVPVFLCGESMGALLVLQAAIRDPWRKRIAGLMLFSPVVALAQENPAWLKALLLAAARTVPNLRLRPGWFVHGKAAMPKLSRIEERQQYLATAPHRLGPLTLRFLAHMGDLIESSAGSARRLEVPVAIFSGGHDVFTTAAQFQEFFASICTPDKTHFRYEESYHQLFFDLDAQQVVAEAAEWVRRNRG